MSQLYQSDVAESLCSEPCKKSVPPSPQPQAALKWIDSSVKQGFLLGDIFRQGILLRTTVIDTMCHYYWILLPTCAGCITTGFIDLYTYTIVYVQHCATLCNISYNIWHMYTYTYPILCMYIHPRHHQTEGHCTSARSAKLKVFSYGSVPRRQPQWEWIGMLRRRLEDASKMLRSSCNSCTHEHHEHNGCSGSLERF